MRMTGKQFSAVLTALLFVAFCSVLSAQVAPAAMSGTTVVSAGSEAMALHYLGGWSVANHSTESFDILDWGAQKGNSFSVQIHQLVAPTPGFNSYLVGGQWSPDISGIINGSNLSGDQFRLFMQAAGGETTLPIGARGTVLAGGGVSYMITPNITWTTVDGYWLYFNGGSSYAVSSGLQYAFNGQQSQSYAVQRMLIKAAKKAAAIRGR